MDITGKLFELRDAEYADFQLKLTPGFTADNFIGVRMPAVRRLAKEIGNSEEAEAFMQSLPHRYYDENMLHGALISGMKDYGKCLAALEEFLPYMDNWAVCDTTNPKVFAKHKEELLIRIREWIKSGHTYTCRYGIGMLMRLYLDGDFKPEYNGLPAAVKSSEYYVNMMIAWYYATALAKQWDATIGYIENNRLDVWVHNKTIQKARESFRITDEQKAYLKTLKR